MRTRTTVHYRFDDRNRSRILRTRETIVLAHHTRDGGYIPAYSIGRTVREVLTTDPDVEQAYDEATELAIAEHEASLDA